MMLNLYEIYVVQICPKQHQISEIYASLHKLGANEVLALKCTYVQFGLYVLNHTQWCILDVQLDEKRFYVH